MIKKTRVPDCSKDGVGDADPVSPAEDCQVEIPCE